MKKVSLRVPTMAEREIPLCPYCGGTPVVETDTARADPFSSDYIRRSDVTCVNCGLNAPLPVWEALAEAHNEPVLKDNKEG